MVSRGGWSWSEAVHTTGSWWQFLGWEPLCTGSQVGELVIMVPRQTPTGAQQGQLHTNVALASIWLDHSLHVA